MGKVTHETWFEIAAKLMPSFAGAFNQAKSKMSELGKTAQTVGKQFQNVKKWVLGVGAAAVAAIAAFGIGAVLKKAFGGAIEAAQNYLVQNQKIESILEANMRRHKVAPELIAANTEALKASTEELGKQGVLGTGIYRQSLETLATYGRSPQEIAKMMPVLGDVLVGVKGVNASTEQMAELSTAVGKAIQGGPLRALGQYNIDLSKITAKQWKQMSVQERINWLTQQWGTYAGQNAKQVESDLGAMRQFNNAIGGLSRRIGMELLPVQASLARFWSQVLPDLAPIVVGVMSELGGAIRGIADRAREAYPAMREAVTSFVMSPEVQKMWNDLGDALNRIGAVIGPVVVPFLLKIGEALGTWALDVIVRGVQQLADDLQTLAGAVEWLSNIENVSKAFDDFGTSVQNAINQIPVIKDVIPEDYGSNLANNLKTEWGGMQAFLGDPVKFMAAEWTRFGEDMRGFGERIKGNWEQLGADFGTIGTRLGEVWGGFIDGQKARWDEFVADLGTIGERIGQAFSGVVDAVVGFFQQAWDGAQQVWADLAGIFGDVVGAIGTALAGVTEAIKAPFMAAINAIKEAWDALVNAIKSFDIGAIAQGAAKKIQSVGSKLTGGLIPAPGSQFGGIFSSPQVRTIAEAGPEAVIPMERTGRAQGLLARAAGAIGGMGRGATSIGGATMNFAPVINVAGAASPEAIGEMQSTLRRMGDEFMARLGEFENRERRLAFE